jgi:hypothetical protein
MNPEAHMYSEETASPGLWKSEIVGLLGVLLIGAAFVVPPGTPAVYLNWFVGFIAANVAIGMEGNRRWERPLAAGAAIWLFISGFVPSVLTGRALFINEIAVGTAFVVAAISAQVHLRDDIRHARPLKM